MSGIYKTHTNASGETSQCNATKRGCPLGPSTPHLYYDDAVGGPTLPPAHHINSFIVNATLEDIIASYLPITQNKIYKDYLTLKNDYDSTVDDITADIKSDVGRMADSLELEVATKGDSYDYINDFSIDEGRLSKLVSKKFDVSLSETIARKYVAMRKQEKMVRRLASSVAAQRLIANDAYPKVS